MKTKILSCLLTVAILFSTLLLGIPSVAAEPALARWDGSTAASFAGGAGTAEDPWQISNGAELAYLASIVNSNGSDTYQKYYILTADIDLGGQKWVGIGNKHDSTKAFKGIFDGNGKVITGFTMQEERDYTPGLFGMLDGGAVVKNLTLYGRVLAGSKYDFGGVLCVSVQGGSAVENCTVYADVDIARAAGSKNFYFGGITGRLAPGGRIEGCTVYGNIQLRVTVSATNNQRQMTAGIAARIDAAQITNCTNYADISQVFTGNFGTIGYSGGIVATGEAAQGATVSILNCVNYGNLRVDTKGGHGRTGGMIGNPRSAAAYTLENCFNVGKILYGEGTEPGNMGELVGWNEAGKLELKNCYARGGNLVGNKGATLSESGCVANITPKTLTGASVRLDDPTGLRFATEIAKSMLDKLNAAEGVTVKIGTLIAPTKYVKAAGTFTADALDAYKNTQGFAFDTYINVPFDTNVYKFLEETDSAYTFSGAIAKLYESNYNMAYSAVGYLTITTGELSVTFYSDYIEQDHSRSIASVAKAAYADRSNTQSDEYPFYVEEERNYSPYNNNSLAIIKKFASAYAE